MDSIPSPGSSSSAAFFFFYPTSFPKGIILVATVTGRRQRENSFVVLFDSAAVSLRQNSLDQFFFFGKLSFSWLEWLQNSFSKGERADGHPFLFKSIEPKLHERCQFRRENLYIMSNESMLALSKCDKPYCKKSRTKLDYWNPKPNSTMNILSLLLYLSLHKAFRHDLAMTTSRREKEKAKGLALAKNSHNRVIFPGYK